MRIKPVLLPLAFDALTAACSSSESAVDGGPSQSPIGDGSAGDGTIGDGGAMGDGGTSACLGSANFYCLDVLKDLEDPCPSYAATCVDAQWACPLPESYEAPLGSCDYACEYGGSACVPEGGCAGLPQG